MFPDTNVADCMRDYITFNRNWALMTDLEKKARGLEWIVDVIVQLPDNCTVPLYYDADKYAVPQNVHFGINEDRASSLPAPQVHFALVPNSSRSACSPCWWHRCCHHGAGAPCGIRAEPHALTSHL